MNADQIKEWNASADAGGFATVEQQERLGRIFNALRSAVEATGRSLDDVVIYTGRKAISADLEFVIEQDATMVMIGHEGAVGFRWNYNGEFINLCPIRPTGEFAAIIADALGRLV
jgi:hypothetical protein